MSGGKTRTEKKDAPEKATVKKTPEELATAHLAKVEHDIKAVEKWTGKLAKAMTSRKYPLTEAQTRHALEYLAKVNDKFVQTIAGKVEAKPEFKLPQ